ncbi:hypothetical protein CYMTET_23280 [Cymbomonas tetramitiformis]|uniref:F5/8 type C domain-containing protein n=1 Tax=Cymbomonas tetramitiformis TaxID=36881 RepID=A0AAE0FYK6_9CHLO|nr:hypothetical protein CYMTET_23280 [Cymbomonas tetramitiformis]
MSSSRLYYLQPDFDSSLHLYTQFSLSSLGQLLWTERSPDAYHKLVMNCSKRTVVFLVFTAILSLPCYDSAFHSDSLESPAYAPEQPPTLPGRRLLCHAGGSDRKQCSTCMAYCGVCDPSCYLPPSPPIPASAAFPPGTPVNYALSSMGATATSSGAGCYNGYCGYGSEALDGVASTFWSDSGCQGRPSTAPGSHSWLQVDLGTERNIGRIEVLASPDMTYDLQAASEPDGPWAMVASHSCTACLKGDSAGHGEMTYSFPSVPARFVRMDITFSTRGGGAGACGWDCCLWATTVREFRVLPPASAPPTPPSPVSVPAPAPLPVFSMWFYGFYGFYGIDPIYDTRSEQLYPDKARSWEPGNPPHLPAPEFPPRHSLPTVPTVTSFPPTTQPSTPAPTLAPTRRPCAPVPESDLLAASFYGFYGLLNDFFVYEPEDFHPCLHFPPTTQPSTPAPTLAPTRRPCAPVPESNLLAAGFYGFYGLLNDVFVYEPEEDCEPLPLPTSPDTALSPPPPLPFPIYSPPLPSPHFPPPHPPISALPPLDIVTEPPPGPLQQVTLRQDGTYMQVSTSTRVARKRLPARPPPSMPPLRRLASIPVFDAGTRKGHGRVYSEHPDGGLAIGCEVLAAATWNWTHSGSGTIALCVCSASCAFTF